MNYDDILDELGDFGKWNQMIIFSLWIPNLFAGIHNLMYAFTALPPRNGYRCQIPSCEGTNFSFSDFDPNELFPSFDKNSSDYNPKHPNYCRFYNPIKLDDNSTCSHQNFNKKEIIECQPESIFYYKDYEMSSTIVTQWDLVCEDGFKGPLTGSLYMVGLLIGSLTLGALSDRYGRKPILMLSCFLSSGGGVMGAFMPEYYSFTISRILTGFGALGLIITSITLMTEFMGTRNKVPFLPWVSYRTFFCKSMGFSHAGGSVIMTLVANFVRDWQTLQWTVSAFGFLQLLLWFSIPESPRWLIAHNREKEAVEIFKKAAKLNKKNLSPHLLQFKFKHEDSNKKNEDSKKPQYGLKDLFNKSLLKITIILWVCWPVVALNYYGLSFSMGHLNDDFFMSFILSSLVELPAVLFPILFFDVWGRKPVFSFSVITVGLACTISGFLDHGVLKTTLALVGKLFATASFSIAFQFTSELYPTLIRNTAVGMCSAFSRIGSISAPFIATYLPLISSDSTPFLVMGVAGCVAGILSLFLPDTIGRPLPDTMEEVEIMKKNDKPAWKCINPMK